MGRVPWLAHRWSGLPALGLHTCWPILVGGGGVGGGGVGGMITYLGLHRHAERWSGLPDDNVPWLHAERWSGLPAFPTPH